MGSDHTRGRKLAVRCCQGACFGVGFLSTAFCLVVMIWILWCYLGLSIVHVSDSQRRGLSAYVPTTRRPANRTEVPVVESSVNAIYKPATTLVYSNREATEIVLLEPPKDSGRSTQAKGDFADRNRGNTTVPTPGATRGSKPKVNLTSETSSEDGIHPRRVSTTAADNHFAGESTGKEPLPRVNISPTQVDTDNLPRNYPDSNEKNPFSRDYPTSKLPNRDEIQSSRRSHTEYRDPDFEREYPRSSSRRYDEDDDSRRYTDSFDRRDRDRGRDTEDKLSKGDTRVYPDYEKYPDRRPLDDERYDQRRRGDDDRYRSIDDDRYDYARDGSRRSEDRNRERADDRYRGTYDDDYRTGEERRYRSDSRPEYRDRDEGYLPRERKPVRQDEERFRDSYDRDRAPVGSRSSLPLPRDDRYREDDYRRTSSRSDERDIIAPTRVKETSFSQTSDIRNRNRDPDERYRRQDDRDSKYYDDDRRPYDYRDRIRSQDDRYSFSDDREYRTRSSDDRREDRTRLPDESREDRIRIPDDRREDRTRISDDRRDDRTRLTDDRRDDRSRVSDDPRDDRIRLNSDRREDRTRLPEDRDYRPRIIDDGREYRTRLSEDDREYRTRIPDDKRIDRRDDVVLESRSYSSEEGDVQDSRSKVRSDDDERNLRRKNDEYDRRSDEEYRNSRPRGDYESRRSQYDDDDRPLSRKYDESSRRYDSEPVGPRKESSSRDSYPNHRDRRPGYIDDRDRPYDDRDRRYRADDRDRRYPPHDIDDRDRRYRPDDRVDKPPTSTHQEDDRSYPDDRRQSTRRETPSESSKQKEVSLREKNADDGKMEPSSPLRPQDVIEAAQRQPDASDVNGREVSYPVFNPRGSNLTSPEIIRSSERRGITLTSRRKRRGFM